MARKQGEGKQRQHESETIWSGSAGRGLVIRAGAHAAGRGRERCAARSQTAYDEEVRVVAEEAETAYDEEVVAEG